MTSISSSLNLSSTGSSPFSNLTDEISSAVQAGVLSQTDATALDSALGSISSALSSSSSDGSTAPGDIKSKVDSLISDQVSSGNLTQDQAKELEAFFAAGPGGAGAPPPPGGQAGTTTTTTAATSTDSGTSSTSSTSDTSGSDDQYQALLTFLKNLKANAAQETGSYSIGQSSSTSTSGTLFSTSA
jgi:hypothetical protein